MPLGTFTPQGYEKGPSVTFTVACRYLSFFSLATSFGKNSRQVHHVSSTSKFANLPMASGRISISVFRRPKKRRLTKLKISLGKTLISIPCRSKVDNKTEDARIGLNRSISTKL
jgi:hypothetical protein